MIWQWSGTQQGKKGGIGNKGMRSEKWERLKKAEKHSGVPVDMRFGLFLKGPRSLCSSFPKHSILSILHHNGVPMRHQMSSSFTQSPFNTKPHRNSTSPTSNAALTGRGGHWFVLCMYMKMRTLCKGFSN